MRIVQKKLSGAIYAIDDLQPDMDQLLLIETYPNHEYLCIYRSALEKCFVHYTEISDLIKLLQQLEREHNATNT